MGSLNKSLITALLAVFVALHSLSVLGKWQEAKKDRSGRDFASYYYAVKVADQGGDPYVTQNLTKAARAEGTRRSGVFPYFYPPTFLSLSSWVLPLDLVSAYRAWFWLDELATLAALLILGLWWRQLGGAVPLALGLSLGLLTAIPNNHIMGQANFPVLFFVLLGLSVEERRPILSGILVGTACMMKMSPALFVMWWLLRGKWTPAISSVVWAVVFSLLTIPIMGIGDQLNFYTQVLPGFAKGTYNGLNVGINLFGNHSFPNIWDAVFNGGQVKTTALTGGAKGVSTLTTLLLLGLAGWRFRRGAGSLESRAAQVGCIGVLMLLIPVMTYEHHIVWAIPAVAALCVSVSRGRFPGWAVVMIGVMIGVWCYDLVGLKKMWQAVGPTSATGVLIRESKFVALLVFYVGTLYVGGLKVEEKDGLASR